MARPRETHGIPEAPSDSPPIMRSFMTQIRNAIVRLQGTRASAEPVTNLRVTPIALANVVDFTRSDGDSYTLWWSTDANSLHANPIPIGNQSRYTHTVGNSGIKIWYWVEAVRTNGQNSKLVGAKTGTTLAAGAVVTIPAPPPPTATPVIDTSTGRDSGFTR